MIHVQWSIPMPILNLTDREYRTLKTILSRTHKVTAGRDRLATQTRNLEKHIRNLYNGRARFSGEDIEDLDSVLNNWYHSPFTPPSKLKAMLKMYGSFRRDFHRDIKRMSSEEKAELFTEYVNNKEYTDVGV